MPFLNTFTLHREGIYPVEHFRVPSFAGSGGGDFPLQLSFAGYSEWRRGVYCIRNGATALALEWLLDGEWFFGQDGRSCTARSGELLLLRPGERTEMRCESATAHKYVFSICGPLLGNTLEVLRLDKGFHAVPTHRERWDELVTEAEYLVQPGADPIQCASFAYRLLLEFSTVNELHAYPAALQKIILQIRRNVASPPTLEELTAAAALSQAAIYRLFRRHLGTTPMEYIRNLRLMRAAELLEESQYSLKEIADLLHFASPQYFSSEFSRKYGHSPREYRKTLQH